MKKVRRTIVTVMIGIFTQSCICSLSADAELSVVNDKTELPSFVREEIPKDVTEIRRYNTDSGKYSFVAIYTKARKGHPGSKLVAFLRAKDSLAATIWSNDWLPCTDYEFEEIPAWDFHTNPLILIRRKTKNSSMESIVAGLWGANLVVMSTLKGRATFVNSGGGSQAVLKVENAGKPDVSYTWNGKALVQM